ncbi:hypothetical protein [Salinirubrum litoreum]|uniref:DUF8159 domain-containing protein n=1 Tax=Salinirubrum litoreum TaxID=1126234 RepID=A0ABD5REK9_9EURY|nr:hypothetical protein [Salinirubrum litoreum]
MRRRTLLAVLGSGLLAGCTSQSDPSETPAPTEQSETADPATDTATATETTQTTTSGPNYAQSFRSRVQSRVSVLSLETADVAELAYTSTAATREEVVTEMAYVAGYFAEVVGDGWSVTTLRATPTRSDGVVIGEWRAESAWAESFVAGDLSDEEYVRRVLDTLTVEAAPDGG